MTGWSALAAFKTWATKLAVSERDDFERAALPLLKFIWPEMVQAPRLKSWDQRGIDLFVWSDDDAFPCAVQCKGFAVQQIAGEQIGQIEESVAKFIASDAVADTYLIAHNRDSRNPDLRRRVEPLLENIKRIGKAKRAEMWDRNQIVNNVFDTMETRLGEVLRRRSHAALQSFSHLFRFGDQYVDSVPAARRELTFRRDAPCSVGELGPALKVSMPTAIAQSSGTRWTLLTGQFGTGKTTAAMRAAASATKPVVLLPCATVPAEVFTRGSTNGLSQHIVQNLDLFADEAELNDLVGVAGAVLSYLFRHGDSPFVFVLDGLDEHHIFASLEGLQRLSNQLAEFSCSVVLTTRLEHFETLLPDFNIAFAELGKRFGIARVVDVIELQKWSEVEVRMLVDDALNAADPAEAPRLRILKEQIDNGRAGALYGDLLFHPLFLQFILEDVAADGVSHQTRPSLLRRSIERKLRRDRAVWTPGTVASRPSVAPWMDTEEFCRAMLQMLEEVAFKLSVETEAGMVLQENGPSSLVLDIASHHFAKAEPNLLAILLNSVLIVHRQENDRLTVGFALRTFHEYLAAAYIVRHHQPADAWPRSVHAFASELTL